MKPYEAGFVNPFRNIYLTFCLGVCRSGLTPKSLRSATSLDQRVLRSAGRNLPHHQSRAAGPARSTLPVGVHPVSQTTAGCAATPRQRIAV